jgi:hypothetical protein
MAWRTSEVRLAWEGSSRGRGYCKLIRLSNQIGEAVRQGSIAHGTRERYGNMTGHRIYTTSVASVYPHYVAKAERNGRTKADLDRIIAWLTGYSQEELETLLEKRSDFRTFFAEAPRMNPARTLIKGVICGIRVENIEEPLMQEIRYLDKLVDELAKGKAMEKILRQG